MLKLRLTRVDNPFQPKLEEKLLESFKSDTERNTPLGWFSQRVGDEIIKGKGSLGIKEFLFPKLPMTPTDKKVSRALDINTYYRGM